MITNPAVAVTDIYIPHGNNPQPRNETNETSKRLVDSHVIRRSFDRVPRATGRSFDRTESPKSLPEPLREFLSNTKNLGRWRVDFPKGLVQGVGLVDLAQGGWLVKKLIDRRSEGLKKRKVRIKFFLITEIMTLPVQLWFWRILWGFWKQNC